MKTLLIYNDIEHPLKFTLVDGDYSRFDNVVFNLFQSEHQFVEECGDFLWDENGNEKIKFSEDKSLLKNKEWDEVAFITFLP